MKQSAVQILRARWVTPIQSAPIENGAVAQAAGVITDVGPARDVLSRNPGATVEDLGDATVLPGLVNAHTHLELSKCSCTDEPWAGDFTEWVLSLPARSGVRSPDQLEAAVTRATLRGASESLRFGVTCVGDISQHHPASRAALGSTALRATSYAEVLGIGARRPRFDALLARAIAAIPSPSDRVWPALSPHAPYSVDLAGYRQTLALAAKYDLPLATHLAEHNEEAEFLQHHTGPFARLLQTIGAGTGGIETFSGTPIRFAHAIGLLAYPKALLAHVNYCSDEELALLAGGRASVVYCPRTHRHFSHPPHRWREMIAAGVNVAVGTDSTASAPNLNVVEELRLLRRIAPEVASETLWRMVTINAARAVAQEKHTGTVAVGKHADFAVFPTRSADPLTEILDSARRPTHTFVAGVRIPVV